MLCYSSCFHIPLDLTAAYIVASFHVFPQPIRLTAAYIVASFHVFPRHLNIWTLAYCLLFFPCVPCHLQRWDVACTRALFRACLRHLASCSGDVRRLTGRPQHQVSSCWGHFLIKMSTREDKGPLRSRQTKQEAAASLFKSTWGLNISMWAHTQEWRTFRTRFFFKFGFLS
jgi:hypothetical protein